MKPNNTYKALLCLIISTLLVFSIAAVSFAEEPFDIDAKSAILIDAATGKVIYEANPHERLAPASITKIMTLLLTMEALDNNKIKLDDEVIVSANAANMGGSQIYLEEGESQTVEQLLRAISLRSANDGAVALAEHIAGSEELFVKMMNDKCKELGMENTNFVNPNGLPNENHYTSAYDISLMSKELLKHPKVHDWLTLWMSEIMVGKNKDVVQSLVNTNRLIHDYQGANGIKTGFTNDAGHCLAASATRGNLTLISVVLGAPTSNTRFNESKKLLDYGFANYSSLMIAKKGDVIKRLPVSKGKVNEIDIIVEDDISLLIKKGDSANADRELLLPESIDAPIVKNTKVGELILKIDGKDVGRANLIVNEDIEKASFVDIIKRMFSRLLISK